MVDVTMQAHVSRERQTVWFLACFLTSSLPIGLLFVWRGLASAGPEAHSFLVTLNLFVAQDMWIGPLTAATVVAAVAWSGQTAGEAWRIPRWGVAVAASASVVLALALRFLAHHNYALSLDEFLPLFQAEIFRGGNLMAPLGEDAFPAHSVLQPLFTYVDEEHRLWAAHYRPVHAAILSIFPEGYEAALAHALLTGVTVLAMASIARQLFPDRPGAPVLAVCLLLASPQVLLTAASGFAFTTHLAFNSVWLALFLRGSWPAHVAAAVVGFFALGIHQVHVHAIYVFPFGIAMLLGHFGSRWKAVPYAVTYAIGVPLWITWPEIATWLQTGDASVLPHALLEVEYLSNYLTHSETIGQINRQLSSIFLLANVGRFALWLSPAALLLLALALVSRRSLGRVPAIVGLGALFSIIVSHLMLPNPMHTIGSRYYHPVIGNVVVVALACYYSFADDPRLRRAVILLTLAGAVVFLPLRAWQVHQKVGPRAAVAAQLNAMDVEHILIRPRGAWFMTDFVRNDPYLREGPIYYADIGGAPFDLLGEGPVARVSAQDLIEMGLVPGTYLEPDFVRQPSHNGSRGGLAE